MKHRGSPQQDSQDRGNGRQIIPTTLEKTNMCNVAPNSDPENQNPKDKRLMRESSDSCDPNINLNLHDRVGRTELRIVAAITIVLQSGSLLTADLLRITQP